MYIAGFVIPVPNDQREDYLRWAETSASLFRKYGCLETVDGWEDIVPDGSQTDFRRAVAAKPDEKIVFSWQIWPDRATMEAAEAKMLADGAFDTDEAIPFDNRRLIYGCFTPLQVTGREG